MVKQKWILGPAQLEITGQYKRPLFGHNGYRNFVSVWQDEHGWHNMWTNYYSTKEEAMQASERMLGEIYDITIIEDQEQFDKLQLLL